MSRVVLSNRKRRANYVRPSTFRHVESGGRSEYVGHTYVSLERLRDILNVARCVIFCIICIRRMFVSTLYTRRASRSRALRSIKLRTGVKAENYLHGISIKSSEVRHVY